MDMLVIQIVTTVFAVGATIALLAMRQKQKLAASEWRMVRMLGRVGLDPAIVSNGESRDVWESVIRLSINDARQRCQLCSSVDECERWLVSNGDNDNSFCPNASVFKALKTICDDVAGVDK